MTFLLNSLTKKAAITSFDYVCYFSSKVLSQEDEKNLHSLTVLLMTLNFRSWISNLWSWILRHILALSRVYGCTAPTLQFNRILVGKVELCKPPDDAVPVLWASRRGDSECRIAWLFLHYRYWSWQISDWHPGAPLPSSPRWYLFQYLKRENLVAVCNNTKIIYPYEKCMCLFHSWISTWSVMTKITNNKL